MVSRTVLCKRKQAGAALAEGVASLALITSIVIGGVLLIVSSGLMMLYHMKVQSAAQVGANAALSNSEWSGALRSPSTTTNGPVSAAVKANVMAAVNTALQSMGIAPVVDIPTPTVATPAGTNTHVYTVKVSCSSLPLISGGILPESLGVTETATSASSSQSPLSLAWMYFNPPTGIPGWPASGGTAGGVMVPVYMEGAAPGPPLPSGSFPYYTINVAGAVSNAGTGTF